MKQPTTKNYLQTVIAVPANLLLPGAGFIVAGAYKRALQVQGLLLLVTLFICWSRWVFTPTGIQGFLIIILAIYLLNTLLLVTHILSNKKTPWHYKQCLHALLFIFVGYGCLLGGFITKQHWLGVHVYFVPSMSMHPTLKPGQFILLDSWVYHRQAPKLNDVVVFNHNRKEHWLVKRIAQWPDGKLQDDGDWYVLGDNSAQSRDSRYFGGIRSEQIQGQVKLVLLAIDHQQRVQESSFLQPVN